jgi:hypothetical protein
VENGVVSGLAFLAGSFYVFVPRIKLDELERGAFARIGGRMFQFWRLQNMACRNWIFLQCRRRRRRMRVE